jgi:glutathione S-transferase
MGERVDTNAAQTKDTSVLRILSYLPNPRLAKATIVARLCGVRLEVRGAALKDLQEWVWDFDAHPLTEAERESSKRLERAAKTGYTGRLYKTERFLDAHPFGTVPAAFSPDGRVGIFESNSVMRAVARLGSDRVPLYGHDAYGASRIDSFLDASLLFARDTQIYILTMRGGSMTAEIHRGAGQALDKYLAGIERALAGGREFIVGESLTLADICFVAELTLFHNERERGSRRESFGFFPRGEVARGIDQHAERALLSSVDDRPERRGATHGFTRVCRAPRLAGGRGVRRSGSQRVEGKKAGAR